MGIRVCRRVHLLNPSMTTPLETDWEKEFDEKFKSEGHKLYTRDSIAIEIKTFITDLLTAQLTAINAWALRNQISDDTVFPKIPTHALAQYLSEIGKPSDHPHAHPLFKEGQAWEKKRHVEVLEGMKGIVESRSTKTGPNETTMEKIKRRVYLRGYNQGLSDAQTAISSDRI
jgi:hypothetical protein